MISRIKTVYKYLETQSLYLFLSSFIVSFVCFQEYAKYAPNKIKEELLAWKVMSWVIILAVILCAIFFSIFLNYYLEWEKKSQIVILACVMGTIMLFIEMSNPEPNTINLILGSISFFTLMYVILRSLLPKIREAIFDFQNVERDNKYIIFLSLITFLIGLFFGK